MSRLDSRQYAWFVLHVPPKKEFVVQKLLDKDGFATFVPARREYRFANHIARRRKRKSEVTYPVIPRYLFLGMSEHTPGWEMVFRYRSLFRPNVSDARVLEKMDRPKYRERHDRVAILGVQGVPQQCRHSPLENLMARHNKGRFNAPSSHRYMQTHREFKVGDKVLTDDGLFEGRVTEIDGETRLAKVAIDLFGSQRITDVPLDKLVAS